MKPRVVFVFFSNPFAFESILIDALGELEAHFGYQFFGCLFVETPEVAQRISDCLSSAGLNPENWAFIFTHRWGNLFGHKFLYPALLVAEIEFWSAQRSKLKNFDLEGVIVHSEGFLSDFLTLGLISDRSNAILINPLNDLVENSLSVRQVVIKRFRQLFPFRDCRNPAKPCVLLSALASMVYRLVMPLVFSLIQKRHLRRSNVARRFVSGGNCGLYIVGGPTACRILRRFPKENVNTFRQLPEGTSPVEGPTDSLLLLSDAPRDANRLCSYMDALVSDLREVQTSSNLGNLLVRPHPGFVADGQRVCEILDQLGFDVSLASVDEPLVQQMKGRALILGVWSSSLYQALGFAPGSKVVGLLSPSLVMNPSLEVESARGLRWVAARTEWNGVLSDRAKQLSEEGNSLIDLPSSRMSDVLHDFFSKTS